MKPSRYGCFAQQYPESAKVIDALLAELRGQFAAMEAGELPVVQIGKRAKELESQPVDAKISLALDEVFRHYKVRQEKQQQYRDALGTVHYGGAEDATIGPAHHTFAKYPIGGGRANTSDCSALRGQQARRLSELIPDDVSNADRVAIVTELLVEIGFSGTTHENIGSILERHRRSRDSK